MTSQPLDGPLPHERIAALALAYLDADYRWELDGKWHPLTIGAAAADLADAFPQATSFGLLAAWNPHSVERPDADNRAADERLHAELDGIGLPYRAAFSSARNRSWREPSWMVLDMPLPDFDALARRHGQLATVHGAIGGPARLRMYHAPLALARGGEWVDWVR